MKRIRKTGSILVVVALLTALSACGGEAPQPLPSSESLDSLSATGETSPTSEKNAAAESSAGTAAGNTGMPSGTVSVVSSATMAPSRLTQRSTTGWSSAAKTTRITSVPSVCRHDFAPATCTQPKRCRLCGAVSGSAKGHNFKPATAKAPKTCTVCGKTEGSKLPREMTGIAIAGMPVKTTYSVGESWQATGLSVRLNYNDGTSRIIDKGFEVKGFSSAKTGKVTMTVSYQGKTTSFTVNIVSGDVYLKDLSVLERSDFSGKKSAYDACGNYYDFVQTFEVYNHYNSTITAYAVYRLNGNYSRFTGVLGIYDDGFLEQDNGDFIFHVYLDNELIYTKDNITKYSDPIPFNVDVRGGKFLKICAVNRDTFSSTLLIGKGKLEK